MKPETERWLEMSDIDLQAAKGLLGLFLYAPCIFHAHQSVEKALKAVWTELGPDEPPPRTHNLADLADSLGLLRPEWEEFLRRLSNQAVVSRYAGRKAYNKEMAVEYCEKAAELCEQLRRRLT